MSETVTEPLPIQATADYRTFELRGGIAYARPTFGKLSFFVHNFMDSSQLEKPRCEACSFMVMTPGGPMSMCVHNAKRDDYLLVAAKLKSGDAIKYFNPATGQLEDRIPDKIVVRLTKKNARGRARHQLDVDVARATVE